jgi:hypothetical protein
MLFALFWNQHLLGAARGLDIPIQILTKFVEDGISVDLAGIGETLLEIGKGGGDGDDEGTMDLLLRVARSKTTSAAKINWRQMFSIDCGRLKCF